MARSASQPSPGALFASLEEQIAMLKSQGREIYRLDLGSPDLPPAAHILAALHQAADQPDHHGYQPLRHSGV
jgi:aspartate/methionine/tyrosine aminotransferase